MILTSEIIVLHKTKYKDSGLIVHGYSNTGGRQGFIVRNGRSSKNYAAISQLHPLSIIEAELTPGEKGDLKTIREFRTLFNLPSIRTNVSKSTIAIFVSELIYRSIKEVEQNRDLFGFLKRAVLLLEGLEDNYANFHLWFIVEFSGMVGYSPENNFSAQNEYFDIISARFCPFSQNQETCLNNANSHILHSILESGESSIGMLKISGRQRFSFISGMLNYLGHHMGHPINIQSLEILREVFE